MSLDQTDRKILRLLQADGRMTNQDIATKCNISASACHERFKRLRDDGYITGFSAVLDARKLDKAFMVYAQVMLQATINENFNEFSLAASKIPEIMECYMVVGGYDYLLKIRVQDISAYRLFLGNVLSQMPGVREIRTYAVLEQIKWSTELPI